MRNIDVREKHPSVALHAPTEHWAQAGALTRNQTDSFWFAGLCPTN